MFQKLVSITVSIIMLVSVLSSCSSGEKIMEIGYVSVDSVDLADIGSVKAFSTDDNYISDALFKYLYMYFKDAFLSDAMYYEMMGYSYTGDAGVPTGDTEEFWSCKLDEKEDGTVVTMKDYVLENAVTVAKDVLAMEAAAKDYKFIFPDSFEDDLEAAIYKDVEDYGSAYLEDGVEFADENGVVYSWVKARREMYLASKGITAGDWERVFFLYRTVFFKDLMKHLESVGVIKADADEDIEKAVREDLEAQLASFYNDYSKVDLLFYEYKTVDSEEESADTSEDISEDVSKDELSPAEYNKQLLESCNEVLQSIIDGTTTYSDECGKADNSNEDAIVPNTSIENVFGKEALECKSGDIKLYDTDHGVYIVIFKELTEADFGRTTVPTDDELEEYRTKSLNKALDAFLQKYLAAVTVDSNVIDKYNRPWEINYEE